MKKARDVVLLHGWGCSAGVWNDLAGRLGRRLRVHVPDLPGYGAALACEPYTLDGIVADMARNAPERCSVVGWSLGGQIAMEWARSAPGQVARLALIAATPCFAQRADWPHAVATATLAKFAKGLATERARTLRRFISLEAKGDEKAMQVTRRLRAAHAASAGPAATALTGGLRILLGTDLRGALGSIRPAALVVHGDRDSLVPLAAGEYLSRRLPDARLRVLAGAGHAPFLSQPGRVARELRDFFDE